MTLSFRPWFVLYRPLFYLERSRNKVDRFVLKGQLICGQCAMLSLPALPVATSWPPAATQEGCVLLLLWMWRSSGEVNSKSGVGVVTVQQTVIGLLNVTLTAVMHQT